MSKSTLSWLAAAIISLGSASAFIVPSNIRGNQPVANQIVPSTLAETTTSLFAAPKKRRRRKDKSSDPFAQTDDEEDELPDFDLIADIDLQEQAAAKAAAKAATAAKASGGGVASRGKAFDVNAPEVLAAMRAKKGGDTMGSASTKDLLRSRNRELEDKLVVNTIVEDVPSLAEYAKGNFAKVEGGGKKAAKREARRAAAIEKEVDVEVEEESFLSKLPFLNKLPFFNKDKEEQEEKTPVKVSQKRS